jgi:hypothetical protein
MRKADERRAEVFSPPERAFVGKSWRADFSGGWCSSGPVDGPHTLAASCVCSVPFFPLPLCSYVPGKGLIMPGNLYLLIGESRGGEEEESLGECTNKNQKLEKLFSHFISAPRRSHSRLAGSFSSALAGGLGTNDDYHHGGSVIIPCIMCTKGGRQSDAVNPPAAGELSREKCFSTRLFFHPF